MFEKMKHIIRSWGSLMVILGGMMPFGSIYGQELPEIIPPSPQAQAFTKYTDIPVNMYNGLPNVEVPLYTIRARDINVPISLSYHAGGIKVNEEASWAGLGWTLNAGGVISRNVMGLDDFKFTSGSLGYFNTDIPELPYDEDFQDRIAETEPATRYSIEELKRPSYLQFGCEVSFFNKSQSTYTTVDMAPYIHSDVLNVNDFEPDQYSFNFPGGSGKFVMDRSMNVILQKQEKLDIQVQVNNGLPDSWEIKGTDGKVYTFAEFEKSRENTSGAFIRTAWYLTRIYSPMTGEDVTFHYNVVQDEVETIGSVNERDDTGGIGCNQTGPRLTVTTRRYYDRVTLDYIDFSNGRVKLISGTRTDVSGEVKLEKVQIFEKDMNGNILSQPYKEFVLGTSYFGSDPLKRTDKETWPTSSLSDDYFFQRLRLDNVEEISGGLSKGTYSFEYEQTGQIPAKSSFARDYWGYYNGAIGNTRLVPDFKGVFLYTPPTSPDAKYISEPIPVFGQLSGANRRPDPNHTDLFSLKEMTYPTGGTTSFVYENHTFDEKRSQVNNSSPIGRFPVLEDADTSYFYDAATTPAVNNGDLGTLREETLDLSNAYYFGNGSVDVEMELVFRFNGDYASQSSCAGISDNSDLNIGPGSVYVEIHAPYGLLDRIDLSELTFEETRYISGENLSCQDITNQSGGALSVAIYKKKGIFFRPGAYTIKTFAGSNVTGMQQVISRFKWKSYVGATDAEGNIASSTFSYAGGLRIKELIEHDGESTANDKIRKFEYHFKEDRDNNGIQEEYSYGRRMSRPIHSHYEYVWKTEGFAQFADGIEKIGYNCSDFIRTADSNVPLNGTAGGSIVGYDKVTVLHGKDAQGNYGIFGRSEYEYENQPDRIFDYNYHRSPGLPNLATAKNGNLLKQFDYDNSGNLVKELINDYEYENTGVYYAIKPLANMPINLGSDNPPGTFSCGLSNYIYPAMLSEWFQLRSTTEKVYDQDGSGKFVSNVTTYGYETATPKHYQVISDQTVNSNGEVVRNEREYAEDISLYGAGKLRTAHIHNLPLIQKVTVDGSTVSEVRHHYEDLSNGLVYKKKDEVFPDGDTGSSGDGITVDYSYDLNGNLQQVQREDGMYVTYLWGYDHTYPIAKIENATIGDVSNALSGNTDFGKGGISPIQESALRNLSGAMVYTYDYDPLIGILSSSDPNGNVTTYEYDGLGRLRAIKDQQGNVIETYTYHYVTE